jgi:hypothetical protein
VCAAWTTDHSSKPKTPREKGPVIPLSDITVGNIIQAQVNSFLTTRTSLHVQYLVITVVLTLLRCCCHTVKSTDQTHRSNTGRATYQSRELRKC